MTTSLPAGSAGVSATFHERRSTAKRTACAAIERKKEPGTRNRRRHRADAR
jgi:hypothetical protein